MRTTCGNLKGGAGKTTSAVFLACGLARAGWTLLVDADPYGQLLGWPQADGLPATVIAWPVKDLARRVNAIAGDYDHLVIDTGPNHEALLRQALTVTDVLVIPCAPTLMDVERLGEIFELLEEVRTLHPALDARVLFTKASNTSTDLRDAREGLTAQGLQVCDAWVRNLVHYSRARSGAPTDLADYKAVLAELASVRAM